MANLSWLDSVLPRVCVECELHTYTDLDLCPHCTAALPWNHFACTKCALPLPAQGHECIRCVKDLPPFTAAFAPLIYQPPVSNWVHAMKFSGHPVYTNILATLTTRYLQERIFDCRPDVLIPVPLSRRRLIRRGHNQALLLAHPLARTLCIPLTAGLVVRNRHTMPQQGLTRTVRLRNLRDVFEVTEAPPAHVAIVDDVMTTTATTTEIARTLLQAGAGRVDVWVAARATLSR